MSTLPDYFAELLTAIEPDANRLEAARDYPAAIRDFLKKSQIATTVEPHSRLVGSYARHTAIGRIKDVDTIIFVDEYYRDEPVETVLNAVFSALKDLPTALGETGEASVRRRQRRSVNVSLEKAQFSLDIVPALMPRGIDGVLEIPDRDWSKWVPTHPLGYGKSLSELNGQNGAKVVPLIKMMKAWRDFQMVQLRPKSYWLECLVYNSVKSGAVYTDRQSFAELFVSLLSAILDQFQTYLDADDKVPEICDPMLGNNVAFNWDRSAFESFMTRARESRNWGQRALNADQDQDAVDLWVKIFGDANFPVSAVDLEGRRLRRSLQMGSVYASRDIGRISVDRPVSDSVRIPPQRFYGSGDD